MSEPELFDPTLALLETAGDLAGRIDASAVLVMVNYLPIGDWKPDPALEGRLVVGCRTETELTQLQAAGYARVVRIPPAPLSRMAQIKVTILLGLTTEILAQGQRVVCLAGLVDRPLDLLFVTEAGSGLTTPLLATGDPSETINPEVLGRVIEIAVELGNEGREGKPVGTLFVIGDHERVKPLTRQMILNPFFGYPEDQRNILDDLLTETLKELATVDGAFLIRSDGVIESAGTFLKTSALPEEGLPSGLGARHQAASGITLATGCVAITVSQSTGRVCVFRDGEIVTELDQAHAEVREVRKRK
ncbi:MAG: DNA integrity scanning protein DisA nucleotide-binding domain protein [Planctomycetes bacterium]|nr:DNA integrity scanning protein DisA nucleotide-binding domain protein [Planctomycetota bacterium]